MNSPVDADHPLLSRRYKVWLVFVLFLVSVFNYADRAILSVLAQPIKEDLKLTDTDLGMLQGLAFAILYSVLGVPLGWLAERVSRKGVIAACVAAWSFMTAACGLAGSFAMLLLGRIGVGIGEAGFQPPVSSLISDHFRADRRGSILALISLGSPFGFLVGQSIGGWIAGEWSWRAAFFALGVPGLLTALLVWLTLREPPRGLADGYVATAEAPSLPGVLKQLWALRTFRHLLLAWSITGIAFNAVAQFILPFYLRSFGLPLAVAGAAFGLVAFTSNSIGMLLGGFGFDRLSRRDPRWSVWGPAAALLLATPLYFGAFVSAQVWISMGFIWFANLMLASYFAPTLATFQNLVGPRMRASTTALVFLALGLVGTGFGPTLLGVASDFFASQSFGVGDFIGSCPGGRAAAGAADGLDHACRAASTEGLRRALIAVLVFFVWGIVHYVLAARTLRQELYRPPTDLRSAGAGSSPA